jgi:CO/xanthine dehydrogenase FAD-binding subunit
MVERLNPSTLEEALKMRKNYPNAILYAGGSDLMVAKKSMDETIFINGLSKLQEVTESEQYISIGAGAIYYNLLQHPLVPELLKRVIREIASPAIRNMATIGGNICNASPAGDTLPILYLYDAKLVLVSLDEKGQMKERIVPIEEFILGIRKINLNPDEILARFLLEKERIAEGTKVAYQKVGARKAQAISKLQFVAMVTIENEVVKDLRIAYGSVGVTVIRKKEIEKRFIGISEEELSKKIPEIIKAYDECIHPIDDQRSTAIYRKKVCLNLLGDFLSR